MYASHFKLTWPKAMRAYAMAQHPSSVRRQLFPLNDFFSRTTWPISTKLCRKHSWGWGFRFVQI